MTPNNYLNQDSNTFPDKKPDEPYPNSSDSSDSRSPINFKKPDFTKPTQSNSVSSSKDKLKDLEAREKKKFEELDNGRITNLDVKNDPSFRFVRAPSGKKADSMSIRQDELPEPSKLSSDSSGLHQRFDMSQRILRKPEDTQAAPIPKSIGKATGRFKPLKSEEVNISAELKEERDGLKQKVEELEKELVGLKTSEQQVRKERDHIKSKYDGSAAINKEQVKYVSIAKETTARLKAENSSLEELLEAQKLRADSAERISGEALRAASDERKKIESAEAQKAEAEQKLRDLEKANSELTQKLSKLNSTPNVNPEEVEKINSEKAKLENEVQQLRTQIGSQKTEYDKKLSEAEIKVEEAETARSAKHREWESKARESAELKMQSAELEKKLGETQAESERIKKDIEKAKFSALQANSRAVKAGNVVNSFSKLKLDYDNLLKANKVTADELEEKKAEISRLQGYEARTQAQEAELSRLQAEIANFTAIEGEHKASADREAKKNIDLEARLAERTAENANNIAHYSSKLIEADNNYSTLNSSQIALKEERDGLKLNISNLESELEKAKQEKQHTGSSVHEESVRKLTIELEEAKKELERNKEAYVLLEKEKISVASERDEFLRKFADVEKKYATSEQEKETLNNELSDEKQKSAKETEALELSYRAKLVQANAKKAKIAGALDAAKERISSLETQLEDSEIKHSEYVKAKEIDLGDLEDKNDRLVRDNTVAEDERADAVQKLQVSEQNHSEYVKSAEAQIKALGDDNGKLVRELNGQDIQISDDAKIIKDLKHNSSQQEVIIGLQKSALQDSARNLEESVSENKELKNANSQNRRSIAYHEQRVESAEAELNRVKDESGKAVDSLKKSNQELNEQNGKLEERVQKSESEKQQLRQDFKEQFDRQKKDLQIQVELQNNNFSLELKDAEQRYELLLTFYSGLSNKLSSKEQELAGLSKKYDKDLADANELVANIMKLRDSDEERFSKQIDKLFYALRNVSAKRDELKEEAKSKAAYLEKNSEELKKVREEYFTLQSELNATITKSNAQIEAARSFIEGMLAQYSPLVAQNSKSETDIKDLQAELGALKLRNEELKTKNGWEEVYAQPESQSHIEPTNTQTNILAQNEGTIEDKLKDDSDSSFMAFEDEPTRAATLESIPKVEPDYSTVTQNSINADSPNVKEETNSQTEAKDRAILLKYAYRGTKAVTLFGLKVAALPFRALGWYIKELLDVRVSRNEDELLSGKSSKGGGGCGIIAAGAIAASLAAGYYLYSSNSSENTPASDSTVIQTSPSDSTNNINKKND